MTNEKRVAARKPPEEWEDHGEPVVIPLPPEDALRALLAVKPDSVEADENDEDSKPNS